MTDSIPIVRPWGRIRAYMSASASVRRTVDELEQAANLKVLLMLLLATRTEAALYRWLLELQAVPDDVERTRAVEGGYGNYLNKYFAAITRESEAVAENLAKRAAGLGIAVSPNSGYFEHLEHLDPSKPLPPKFANARVLDRDPQSYFIDSFVSSSFDLGYRRLGTADSRVIQLTYPHGTRLDIDYNFICDNVDPAPWHAWSQAYIGPGKIVFPLRIGRSTAPLLWQEKKRAIARTDAEFRAFARFATLSITALASSLPVGGIGQAISNHVALQYARRGVLRRAPKAGGAQPAGPAAQAGAKPETSQQITSADEVVRPAITGRGTADRGTRQSLRANRGAGQRATSARVRAARENRKSSIIRSQARAEMLDTLLDEHKRLHVDVADHALKAAIEVGGKTGSRRLKVRQGDILLAGGVRREVTVTDGVHSIKQALLNKAGQGADLSEIFLQVGPAGATPIPSGAIREIMNELRVGLPDLAGILVTVFNSNGKRVWRGRFQPLAY